MRRSAVILAGALGLYAVNRWTGLFQSLPAVGPVFRFHFNDFLGSLVLCAYLDLLCRRAGVPPVRRLPTLLMLGAVCSLFWEGLAPLLLPYSTADWRDCIAYLLGTVFYWLLLRIGTDRKKASPHRR